MATAVYNVVAPCSFTRRNGACPIRALTHEEKCSTYRENSQQLENHLEEWQLFKWYRDVANGKTDPRRGRKGMPHPFGVVSLELTPVQYRQLRRNFPQVIVLPRRRIRLPKVGRLAGSNEPVDSLGKVDPWHLNQTGLLGARQDSRVGLGRGVKIAVIDSGISRLHPEFTGKTIDQARFHPDTGKFLGFGGSDTQGHGTAVASLIAGASAGVAPEADLLSLQTFPEGIALDDTLRNALHWLLDPANGQHVHIVNISAGFAQTPAFAHVINQLMQAGVLVVCASGNSKDKCSSPGDYESVLTVGACGKSGAPWTNSGSSQISTLPRIVVPDLLAPGILVGAAWLDDKYVNVTGTSFATPIVSGLAALEFEKRQMAIAVDQVIDTLMNRADPPPDPNRSTKGIAQV